jgi:lipid-A-disaccharide synthase
MSPDSSGADASARPDTVFISAGEASGDWSGSLLLQALHAARPELVARGIGGKRLAAAGMELVADSSTWGAIGLLEGLMKVPQIWGAMQAARADLTANPPSLLVLIDCGAFNMRLARAIRGLSIPTLYYFPPGSWSRKPRDPELCTLVDAVATPFPWSAKLLAGGRARVEWVGHPVVESARPRISAAEAAAQYGIDPTRPVVAIAPGSREQELRHLLPVFAAAAAQVQQALPGTQFLVPVAPTLDRDRVAAVLARAGVTATLLDGMDYDALQLAQAAAVCSGTATLEFCCLGLPMVVAYRASLATAIQYRLLRGLLGRQRFAAMPNIIAEREIIPERLGAAATPESIAEVVIRYLRDESARAEAKRELAAVAEVLGPPGASARAAALALDVMAGRGVAHAATG